MEPIEVKEFRNRIGKAIRKLRKEEGISAQFLAKTLDVTQPTISRIENGITAIPADKLCFLAKSFNKPLSYFVGEQSPTIHSEEDILRAGLVFYGAKHLKSKRTIDVERQYHTYVDFLNAALNEVDDTRFAAALATTLYCQAEQNKLKFTKILSTIVHERLIANLLILIKIIEGSRFYIKRPSKEKERALQLLSKLAETLEQGHADNLVQLHTVANLSADYVARFINASTGNE